MPRDRHPNDEKLKVTDRRMFTSEGEIKAEFRDQVNPVDPSVAAPPPPPVQTESRKPDEPQAAEKKKSLRDREANPGTAFTIFVETLIFQAYMSLGMVANPNGQAMKPDLSAAKQLIDILALLELKTKGNLTEEESDFLNAHMGQLKLVYVRSSKTI
ncbi:MAG TPA: DUF1844 domain-containing protein [Thermoanaerobaculia bacterium]|nr:DUF1844 domain-containing protein [Thermoanaerobaculia bacterium]